MYKSIPWMQIASAGSGKNAPKRSLLRRVRMDRLIMIRIFFHSACRNRRRMKFVANHVDTVAQYILTLW